MPFFGVALFCDFNDNALPLDLFCPFAPVVDLDSTARCQPNCAAWLKSCLFDPGRAISAAGHLDGHDAPRRRNGDEVRKAKEVAGDETMRYALLHHPDRPTLCLKRLDAGAIG